MKMFFTIIAAMFVVGCTSNMGTESVNDFGNYSSLKPGETDKTGVYKLFGQPHEVTYIGETGESRWQYYSMKAKINPTTAIPFVGLVTGGSDVDITQGTFFFDPNGKLIDSNRSTRTRYKNMWLSIGDSATRSNQSDAIRREMASLELPYDEALAKETAAQADQYAD